LFRTKYQEITSTGCFIHHKNLVLGKLSDLMNPVLMCMSQTPVYTAYGINCDGFSFCESNAQLRRRFGAERMWARYL